MKNDSLIDFFGTTSKIIIFIPIIIVVLALIFRFNQTKSNITNIVLTPTPSLSSRKPLIDLNGSYHCVYNTGKRKIEAFIKQKNIQVFVTEQGATKKYDLTQYSSVIEGFLNEDFPSLSKTASAYGVDLQKAIDSCQKD